MRVVLTENVFFSEIENDFLKKKKKIYREKSNFLEQHQYGYHSKCNLTRNVHTTRVILKNIYFLHVQCRN